MKLSAQPKNTHAIVVGVETYACGAKWNLDGPARDALRFIEWLRKKDVPPGNIRLFWSPLQPTATPVRNNEKSLEQRLREAQLKPGDAKFDLIFKAVSDDVPHNADLLFLFWGGHGVVDGDERRLFCADATQATKQNLNLNSLLQYMHSRPYRDLRQQVIIVDSCANYFVELRSVAGLPRQDFPSNPPEAGVRQFAFFSAGPGQYATNISGRKTGAFSEQLLAVFESEDGWPDIGNAYRHVYEHFAIIPDGQRPTYLRVMDWEGNEEKTGSVQPPLDTQRIETAKSFAQILDVAPDSKLRSGSGPPLYDLPALTSDFVGREELLQALTLDWNSMNCCVSVVFGLGGEGKSTAVRYWIEDLRQQQTPPETSPIVLWWTFKEELDADRFFEAVIKYLAPESVARAYRERRGELLAELMRRHEYLLVLDGIEVLQSDRAEQWGRLFNSDMREFLHSFATGGHGSHCVITSQMPLSDLNNYLVETDHAIEPLSVVEGRKLFERLGVHEVTAPGEPTLEDLAERCGRHALTIAVLAAYIVDQGGNATTGFELLPNIATDGQDDRLHNLLRSYNNRLSAADREFLTICSAFRRPIAIPVVSAVFRASIGKNVNQYLATLDEPALRKLMARLVRFRLLIANSDPETYGLHPLIQNHYSQRLATIPGQDRNELHRVISRYYLSLSTEGAVNARSLEDLTPLIEAVHHGCQAGEFQQASKTFWDKIVGPNRHNANVLIHRFGAVTTDLALVSEFFHERDLNSEPLIFEKQHRNWLVNEAGVCQIALGNPREAIRYLERAASDAVKNEMWNEAATTFANQAAVKCFLGELQAAMLDATRARDYAINLRESGAKEPMMAHAQALQGWIAHQMGNLEQADMFFGDAGLSGNESRHLWPSAVDWIHYADFLLAAGSLQRSRAIALEALGMTQITQMLPLQSMTYRLLGDLDNQIRDLNSATLNYDTAIRVARLTNRREILIEALLAAGRYALGQSDLRVGASHLSEALQLSGENEYRPYEAEARLGLAQIRFQTGKPTDSQTELRQAEDLLRNTGYVPVNRRGKVIRADAS